MDDDPVRSVAERLLWLLDVVLLPVGDSTAAGEPIETRWRRYTAAELVNALNTELGTHNPHIGYALLERLQAGEQPSLGTLEALARVFGTSIEYFGDDPTEVAAAQDALLERALRDIEVTTMLRCRGAVLSPAAQRTGLRRVLDIIRPARIPDRYRPEAGTPNPHTSPTPPWQHQHRPASASAGVSAERSQTQAHEGAGAMHRLTTAELRQLCLSLLSNLDIAPPFTPTLLCERLGETRGRPIKLVAAEVFTTASVGHLICKRRRDLIVYQRDAPPAQQAHVIFHEVLHLILDHSGGQESLCCGGTGDNTAGLYAAWQEWEAETGATILSELARRPADPLWVPRSPDAHESGLAATFGLTRGHWR